MPCLPTRLQVNAQLAFPPMLTSRESLYVATLSFQRKSQVTAHNQKLNARHKPTPANAFGSFAWLHWVAVGAGRSRLRSKIPATYR